MSVPRFIQDTRRFARLSESGVEPPELTVNEEIAAALQIDAITLGNIENAGARERLTLLHPFIERHLAEQRRARSEGSMQMAFVHAQRLRGEARYLPDGVELAHEPIRELIDVAAFKVIELRPEDGVPWTFERVILKRILAALGGCGDIGILLRSDRLVVRYRNAVGGPGQFMLLDQPIRSGDVFRVDLPAHHEQPKPQQAVNAIAISDPGKTNASGRTPTWLQDGAQLLIDALIAAAHGSAPSR